MVRPLPFVLLLILPFHGFSADKKKLSCADVRTGRFKVGDNTSGTTILERTTDSTQTEINERDGVKVNFIVRWTDSCTYTLEVGKVIKDSKGYFKNIPEFAMMTVHITEVTPKYYNTITTSNIFEGEVKAVVKILDLYED